MIVSFGTTVVEKLTVPVPARSRAFFRLSGSACAAVSAAVSRSGLELPRRPVPRGDVERGRREHRDGGEEGDADEQGGALAHSTRSVVELFIRPDFTMTPRRLIEYG